MLRHHQTMLGDLEPTPCFDGHSKEGMFCCDSEEDTVFSEAFSPVPSVVTFSYCVLP